MLILWQLNLNPKQSVHRNPSNRKFPSGSSNSSKRIQNRKTLVTEDKTKENEALLLVFHLVGVGRLVNE